MRKAYFLFDFYTMPTTKAATKALKVSQKKRSRNRRYLELFKEATKKFQAAVTEGNVSAQTEALSLVYSRIDTLEKKNIIHKNNAARKKSAFAKALKTNA